MRMERSRLFLLFFCDTTIDAEALLRFPFVMNFALIYFVAEIDA